MKVLMVMHSALPGGANTVVLSLLRHIAPGVSTRSLFLEPGPVAAQAQALGSPSKIYDSGRAREFWKYPRTVAAVRREAADFGADVIFAHVSKAMLYAGPAARSLRLPVAYFQQEQPSERARLQKLAQLVTPDLTFANSAYTAAEQRARFPRQEIAVVLLGAELPDPLPDAHVHTAGAGEEVVLGITGRLQRWKRVELVIAALPHILEQEPRVRLRVIGDAHGEIDPEYPGELRALAEQLGVAGAVDFLGHRPDGFAAIAELDVLVHAADHEPFGLVLVEAMAAGVPVVAPAEGGPVQILRDGTDGVFADPRDARAYAAAVLSLVRDPARRAAMGAAARERALEQFTAARMAAEVWQHVAKLAAARR